VRLRAVVARSPDHAPALRCAARAHGTPLAPSGRTHGEEDR
jgi:hypothetical protein